MEKKVRTRKPAGGDKRAYRGRQATRSGSEARRRTILEATLRIIVRDGIRAVRHRAVAKEAGVPLSATTYYFKDIHDLIADTFTLFAENAMNKVVDPVWVQIHQYVSSFGGKAPSDPAQRAEFVGGLARLAANFVENELNDHREHLLAEQAFLQAALVDEKLRDQAAKYRQGLLDGIVMFCRMIGTTEPDLDAEMILEAFLRLEYENLVNPVPGYDRARAERVLAHRFGHVFTHR